MQAIGGLTQLILMMSQNVHQREFTFFDFEAAIVFIMQALAQFMQFILRQSDRYASCSVF